METRREFLSTLAAGAVASARGASAAAEPTAQQPVQGQGTHLGTLDPFIRSQQVKGEFPLSYLNPGFRDYRSWKRKARGKLLDLLHYAPPRVDPKPELLERVDRGDYIQERVTFNTTPDIRVPAYVLIPKNVKLPAPGIVALHDHGGFYFYGKEKLLDLPDEHPVLTDFKRNYYGGKSIATELVKQGYVVVVIDMFYWGERRMVLDEDPEDWKERPKTITPQRIAAFNARSSGNEQLVGRSIYSAGFTWSGVMFWDDIRTVDYLLTRPEVDRNRIGCCGLSVGGFRTIHLAALDDRIKAAAAVGWMTSFPTQLKNRIVHTIGFTMLVPGLYRHLDYPDVATLAMPNALLVINGSRDGLFETEGVQRSFDKLNAAYRKAGIPDKVKTSLYDAPHRFDTEMQSEAWSWLSKWLKP